MFIFLKLTLHSFGPENFVQLGKIGKFQQGLIKENEDIKWCITNSQHAIPVWKKSSKTNTARTYAPTRH
jgi:hypothetical protein